MPRKIAFSNPSRPAGRFEIVAGRSDVTKPISLAEDKHYRVINSGRDPFTVIYGNFEIEVRKKCSVDVKSANGTLQIRAGSGTTAEGVYEVVEQSNIRSGRFSANLPSGQSLPLARNIANVPFRIHNTSNATDFTLRWKSNVGGEADFPLPRLTSMDNVQGLRQLEIVNTTDAPISVEGVYDVLLDTDIRNGTFIWTSDGANSLTIIQLSANSPNRKFFYRVINTGEHPFNLNVEGDPEVAAGQSLDFVISDTSVAVSAAADQPLQGVWLLLEASN